VSKAQWHFEVKDKGHKGKVKKEKGKALLLYSAA